MTEETRTLAVDYIENPSKIPGSRLGPIARNASLTKRMPGPAGHLIGGLEAAAKIRNGSRPDRVIVESGVSTAAIGSASVAAGVVALPVGLAVVGAAVFFSSDIGQWVGEMYDDRVPEPPRTRIMRMSDANSIEDSGGLGF